LGPGTSHLFAEVPDAPQGRAVAPVVRAFLRVHGPTASSGPVLSRAAEWYEAEGHLAEAMLCHGTSGDTSAAISFLHRRGEEMMARGMARQIDELVERLDYGGDPELALFAGEAKQLLGDWDGALARYRPGASRLRTDPCPHRLAGGARPLPAGRRGGGVGRLRGGRPRNGQPRRRRRLVRVEGQRPLATRRREDGGGPHGRPEW